MPALCAIDRPIRFRSHFPAAFSGLHATLISAEIRRNYEGVTIGGEPFGICMFQAQNAAYSLVFGRIYAKQYDDSWQPALCGFGLIRRRTVGRRVEGKASQYRCKPDKWRAESSVRHRRINFARLWFTRAKIKSFCTRGNGSIGRHIELLSIL